MAAICLGLNVLDQQWPQWVFNHSAMLMVIHPIIYQIYTLTLLPVATWREYMWLSYLSLLVNEYFWKVQGI